MCAPHPDHRGFTSPLFVIPGKKSLPSNSHFRSTVLPLGAAKQRKYRSLKVYNIDSRSLGTSPAAKFSGQNSSGTAAFSEFVRRNVFLLSSTVNIPSELLSFTLLRMSVHLTGVS